MCQYIKEMCAEVSLERIEYYTRRVSGMRHAWHNYDALEEKADFICECFSSFRLEILNQPVLFHGKTYRNIIGTHYGSDTSLPVLLLGAHYDAAWGSPGADDNASGVAVMLEAAHVLTKFIFTKSIQFVAFTLEEPQPQTLRFLIGSDHFVKMAVLRRRYL